MIFARIDVDITDHPKAIEADLPAFGLWAWGIAYARKHELDGYLRRGAVLKALGGGEGRREAADRLVEVGLWEETAEGWKILKYEEKNETRAEVAERREGTTARKQRSRSSRPPPPSPALSSDVPAPSRVTIPPSARAPDVAVTRPSRVTAGSDSDSDSLSDSDLRSGSGSGSDAGARATPPTPRSSSTMLPPSGSPTPPPPDIPITPDLVANCEIAGAPRPTRAHVVALLAHARKSGRTSLDWPSELLSWMCRERQFGARAGPQRPPEREITSRSYGDGPVRCTHEILADGTIVPLSMPSHDRAKLAELAALTKRIGLGGAS